MNKISYSKLISYDYRKNLIKLESNQLIINDANILDPYGFRSYPQNKKVLAINTIFNDVQAIALNNFKPDLKPSEIAIGNFDNKNYLCFEATGNIKSYNINDLNLQFNNSFILTGLKYKQTIDKEGDIAINNDKYKKVIDKEGAIAINNDKYKKVIDKEGAITINNDKYKKIIDKEGSITINNAKYKEVIDKEGVITVNNDKYKKVIDKDGVISITCSDYTISTDTNNYKIKAKGDVIIQNDNFTLKFSANGDLTLNTKKVKLTCDSLDLKSTGDIAINSSGKTIIESGDLQVGKGLLPKNVLTTSAVMVAGATPVSITSAGQTKLKVA